MSLPLQTAAKLVGSLKWHGDGAKSETDEEWKITGVNSLKAAWPSPAFPLTSPVSYPAYFVFVLALPSAKPLSSLSMKRLCVHFEPMREYRLPKLIAKRINNYRLLIWRVQSLVVSLSWEGVQSYPQAPMIAHFQDHPHSNIWNLLGSKQTRRSRLRWPRNQPLGFRTSLRKPMGDVTMAPSNLVYSQCFEDGIGCDRSAQTKAQTSKKIQGNSLGWTEARGPG